MRYLKTLSGTLSKTLLYSTFLFVLDSMLIQDSRAEIIAGEETVYGTMSVSRIWEFDNIQEEREGAKARCNIWETQMAFQIEQKKMQIVFKKGCHEIRLGQIKGGIYFTNRLSLISL